jgi:phosphomannomutase
MAEELIISISGMRGIIGQNLTPAIAAQYGCAFGKFLKETQTGNKKLTVCIGRDSRPSGQMLESAITAGLCAAGLDVIILGIVTTPCVGVMLRELSCAGGVVITASHNPVQYNGIKLLLDNGIAPSPDQAQKIRQYYFDKNFALAGSVDCGKISFNEQTDKVHNDKVLKIIDRKRIAQKRFKIVVDSVNGAGGRITKKLLAQLGCEVVMINEEPTGIFSHTPEPLAKNLTGLCKGVLDCKADIGFAQDPDADRLAIVDEKGNYIGEEYTLALAAKYIFSGKKGSAAANLSTSRMIDDIAKSYGCEVIRTPVGEANVAGAMVENKCVIGGEGNGGIIDLRVGPIRDSLVGIGLVLELMAQSGMSVSQLVGQIQSYHMIKDKFAADKSQAEKILAQAKKLFATAKLDSRDGYRFDFEDGWVHLRTSNTEPVMRVIGEAKSRVKAEEYIEAVLDIAKNLR